MGEKKCPEILTMPLERVELENNSYHILLPVTLNEIQGDMIVDTGASVTVADSRLFPEEEETDTSVQIQSGSITGDIADVRTVRLKQFCIGEWMLPDLQIAVIDLKYVNEMYDKHLKRKVIGLLGSDFCIAHQAVIDYSTLQFRLQK